MTSPDLYQLGPAHAPGVPEGFRELMLPSGYLQRSGPLYVRRREDGGVVLAVRVGPQHLNVQGLAHGGMLTTLADTALGMNISLARGKRAAQVTVSLTADFLSSAQVGDWLEAHAVVTRLGRTLAYASCDLKVDARTVLRSSAVFALKDKPLGQVQDG